MSHALLLCLVLGIPAISLLDLGGRHSADRGTALAADLGRGDLARSSRGYIVKPIAVTPVVSAHHREPITYTVKDGDVLGSIADTYGLRIDTLRQTNNLADVDTLSIGQQLLIPPANGVMVRVAPGDTIKSLSERFHIDPQVIVEYNLVRDADHPPVGSLLMLPDGTDLTAPQQSTVVSGAGAGNSDPNSISFGRSGYNHFPWGQCTYWVASRRNIPWNGDAWSWFGSARSSGWATGRTPRVGAIMVTWESRYYGHVALVEAVYGDGSYMVSEMNYRGLGVVDHRRIGPGQVPLIGFIYS